MFVTWHCQSGGRLAVHDQYRRLGIGRELVERAEKLLVQRGAKRAYANVLTDSPEGFDFWRSVGYTPNKMVEPYSKNLEP